MKEIFINYLKGLSYEVQEETDDIILFFHNKMNQKLKLILKYYNSSKAPVFNNDFPGKTIIIMSNSDIDLIGIESFEKYEKEAVTDSTIIIYDESCIEHTMKDMWFFLNS